MNAIKGTTNLYYLNETKGDLVTGILTENILVTHPLWCESYLNSNLKKIIDDITISNCSSLFELYRTIVE